MNQDRSGNTNVVDDWIFYRNDSDEGKLYKIRTDGTERARLNQDRSGNINSVDGWIFYRNDSDNGKLYKIRMDGTERQLVR